MFPINHTQKCWPLSIVGILAYLFILGKSTLAGPPDTLFGQNTQPQQRRDVQLTASASCAATACHGGPRPGAEGMGAIRGSEYPLWLGSDPHARSWQTLCGEKSVAILTRLEILKAGQIADQSGFDNCLACHNSSQHFGESRTPERITEGVGCSSCHGPDQLWRAAHTERDWSSFTALASGFSQTKNLLTRARLCASCHVGDRDRDMNHEIIAAGHPALHYEFSTYHRRLPKHWRSGATPNEDNDSYAWLVGQLASLDAFLTLLESRASSSDDQSRWPELAIFDCSSCHQRLTDETYKAPPRASSRLTLSPWYRFGVQQFLIWRSLQPTFNHTDKELLLALQELEDAITVPGVDAPAARNASQRTRLALDRWITSLDDQPTLDGFDINQLHNLVAMSGIDQTANGSWESAAQYYLASVAAKSQWSQSAHSGTVLETSRRLRDALQFRTNTVTPQNRFREGAIHSPGQQSLKLHWQSLQKTLSPDHAKGPQ